MPENSAESDGPDGRPTAPASSQPCLPQHPHPTHTPHTPRFPRVYARPNDPETDLADPVAVVLVDVDVILRSGNRASTTVNE